MIPLGKGRPRVPDDPVLRIQDLVGRHLTTLAVAGHAHLNAPRVLRFLDGLLALGGEGESRRYQPEQQRNDGRGPGE